MKAFTYRKYGGPEVLQMNEVAKPAPKRGEILIKTKAISINPAEWHHLRGSIWLIRLVSGLFKPKHAILGGDVSGVVQEVGEGVEGFQVGDRVFGRTFRGGLAEYVCLKETEAAKMPDSLGYEEAAAIPLAGITALGALELHGKILPGSKVLVNGASGGIGTFAVQLAKHEGAVVHGISSQKNVELVKRLGAEAVINYQQTDFTAREDRYDVIVDLVGNVVPKKVSKMMKLHSTCIMVGFTNFRSMFQFLAQGIRIGKKNHQRFVTMDAKTTTEGLSYLANLAATRQVRPVIGRCFDFQSIPSAFKYLGTRRAVGKIVVTLAEKQ